MSSSGSPVPSGDIGEIVLSGGIINPVLKDGKSLETRLDDCGRFHTGDLGRVDAEGYLYVIGRIDDQINRGGQKISPSSVEETLERYPSVERAIVFGVPHLLLGQQVAAAIKIKHGTTWSEEELLSFVGSHLPKSMLPARAFQVDNFPTAPSGKLSRRALAEQFRDLMELRPGQSYASRNKELVETVRCLMAAVLGRQEFRETDDFFEFGGDSLRVVELMLAIEKELGLRVSLVQIQNRSTALDLAALMDEEPDRLRVTRLEVLETGQNDSLMITYGIGGDTGFAKSFKEFAGEGQAVAVFHSGPRDVRASSDQPFLELADECARLAIRDQPSGPFQLAGYSFGAQLAIATASRLVQLGREVAFVGLIDDESDIDIRNFAAIKEVPTSSSLVDFNKWALHSHTPEFYSGRITYYCAEENAAERFGNQCSGWDEVALGGVEVVSIPGSHHSCVFHAELEYLAPEILRAARMSLSRPQSWAKRAPLPSTEKLLRRTVRSEAKLGNRELEMQAIQETLLVSADQPFWFWSHYSEALASDGDVLGTINAARLAIQNDEWPLRSLLRMTKLTREIGSDPFSSELLRVADEQRSDHPSVELYRYEAYLTLGLREAAERALRVGLSDAPRHFKLRRALAWLLEDMGRIQEAIAVLESLASDNPGLGYIWHELGRLKKSERDFIGARLAFESCVRLDPHNEASKRLLAEVLVSS